LISAFAFYYRGLIKVEFLRTGLDLSIAAMPIRRIADCRIADLP
jgi:hypothetical protein